MSTVAIATLKSLPIDADESNVGNRLVLNVMFVAFSMCAMVALVLTARMG